MRVNRYSRLRMSPIANNASPGRYLKGGVLTVFMPVHAAARTTYSPARYTASMRISYFVQSAGGEIVHFLRDSMLPWLSSGIWVQARCPGVPSQHLV